MIIARLNGGLGNQLFQYACARALALRNGEPLRLDLVRYQDRSYAERRPYLLARFRIQAEPAGALELKLAHGGRFARAAATLAPKLRYQLIQQQEMEFRPEVLAARGNVYLIGYWQSERYFADARETICREFQVKAPPTGKNPQLLEEIARVNAVSVHVRRGDYATEAGFHMLPVGYYQRAAQQMERMTQAPHYFIFSDDPDWARANLPLRPATAVDANDTAHPEEDLRLMRACRHHIIANSTLSWWGAWLCEQPGKIVIAPDRWFGANKDASEIVPAGWLRATVDDAPSAREAR